MKTAITQSLLFSEKNLNLVIKSFEEIHSKKISICFPDDEIISESFKAMGLHYFLDGIVKFFRSSKEKYFFVASKKDFVELLKIDKNIYEGKNTDLNVVFKGYYINCIKDEKCGCLAIGEYEKIKKSFKFIYKGSTKNFIFWKEYEQPIDFLSEIKKQSITTKLEKYFEIKFRLDNDFINCLSRTSPSNEDFCEAIKKNPRKRIVGNKIKLDNNKIKEIDKKFTILECTINTSLSKKQRMFYSRKKDTVHLWGIGHMDK